MKLQILSDFHTEFADFCNPRGYPGEFRDPGICEDLLVNVGGSTDALSTDGRA